MATWQGVARRLKLQASDLGGGGPWYGILIQHPTTREWLQVSDFPDGKVNWIVTTEDGAVVDSWVGTSKMDEYNDILLAEYVKSWAMRMGFIGPRR